METFEEYLISINNSEYRKHVEEIFTWVHNEYPNLKEKIAWNQPMYLDHGTYIIGFSVSSHHIAVSPEKAGMIRFHDEIKNAGYEASKMLFRIKWSDSINYDLLKLIIDYNILEKENCSTFWR